MTVNTLQLAGIVVILVALVGLIIAAAVDRAISIHRDGES